MSALPFHLLRPLNDKTLTRPSQSAVQLVLGQSRPAPHGANDGRRQQVAGLVRVRVDGQPLTVKSILCATQTPTGLSLFMAGENSI